MGFFDKLTESAFKQGKYGEAIYFPHGVLGRGRIIENPARKRKLFEYHKRLIKYLLPFCIVYGGLIGLDGAKTGAFAPVVLILIIAFVRQRILIWGLPKYHEKLTLSEAITTNADAYSPGVIKLLIVNSILIIVVGISIPTLFGMELKDAFVFVLTALVAGLISLVISLKLYKAKKSNK